jgi:hypothetical protein
MVMILDCEAGAILVRRRPDDSNSKRQQQAAAAVRRAHTLAGIVKISAAEG